jgi:prepilin-type N-terminal cleavage/methylation domain-containing protein
MRHRSPGRHGPSPVRAGYTLVELLVVILIILLLSAAALPAILPAINGQRVGSAAEIVYGELTRAHDEAVRANAPRGIRLLPDDSNGRNVLTSSRLVAIESGPDYREGEVTGFFQVPPYQIVNPQDQYQQYPPPQSLPQYLPNGPYQPDGNAYPYLVVHEDKWYNVFDPTSGTYITTVPKTPTAWFYNLRQGDKFSISGSSAVYTIAGPTGNPAVPGSNPDQLINFGPRYISNPSGTDSDGDGAQDFEFLFLVNGNDDDGDGYIDEGFDGINNDGDYYPSGPFAGQPVIDPGFNGIDDDQNGLIDDAPELYLHINADGSVVYPGNPFGLPDGGFPPGFTPLPNEFEQEAFIPTEPSAGTEYVVSRRPVLSTRSREVALPTNVVVDLTTWNTTQERSRLPVDPFAKTVDILIYPNGRVTTMSANSNVAPQLDLPFYHIWLAELDDVYEPQAPPNTGIGQVNTLPMDRNAIPNEINSFNANKRTQVYPPDWPTLQANRRLISINTQTGQILTNRVEQFDPSNLQLPYRAAQTGIKEEP